MDNPSIPDPAECNEFDCTENEIIGDCPVRFKRKYLLKLTNYI